MTWSIEGILSFITLIATIPTWLIAMYTLFRRWRQSELYNATPTNRLPSPGRRSTLTSWESLRCLTETCLNRPVPRIRASNITARGRLQWALQGFIMLAMLRVLNSTDRFLSLGGNDVDLVASVFLEHRGVRG
ncbi:hypothetical protein ASPCAL08688 [Aspergillus calidoustus]|uniref:Uncharacterized protein n=1 Tax=Aspergillus calidoustus TaxID=454130 RepID=A0A0U5CQZ0_ASPCI|nr:hypothetical protein ASPCAL08688 [Aspergillus calidoustus]